MTKSNAIVFITFVVSVACYTFAFADESQTVAVLYFQNNTGNKQLDWLSKGIADMLITDLAKPKGIGVKPKLYILYLISAYSRMLSVFFRFAP